MSDVLENISAGVATDEQFSAAYRAVQNSLALTLIERANSLNQSLTRFDNLLSVSLNKYEELMNAKLATDTVDIQGLARFIESIQTKQIQTIDLFRKIVQGSPLFTSDTLSDEEKMVVKLLKSFRTPEEKTKFLALCKQQLNSNVDE